MVIKKSGLGLKEIVGLVFVLGLVTYAAFTHNGFDDQERNLMFVKTVFQVLKVKFLTR